MKLPVNGDRLDLSNRLDLTTDQLDTLEHTFSLTLSVPVLSDHVWVPVFKDLELLCGVSPDGHTITIHGVFTYPEYYDLMRPVSIT